MNVFYEDSRLKIHYAIQKCIAEENISFLKEVYDDLVYLYENYYLLKDDDYRPASETYGLGDVEFTLSQLWYIKSGWSLSFRVRWMIETINPNYVLYEGSIK